MAGDVVRQIMAAPLALLIGCLGVAAIIGTPVALVTWGHASHYAACESLRAPAQRLYCLTGGDDLAQGMHVCEQLVGLNETDAVQCVAEVEGRAYGAGASNSTAIGGS